MDTVGSRKTMRMKNIPDKESRGDCVDEVDDTEILRLFFADFWGVTTLPSILIYQILT